MAIGRRPAASGLRSGGAVPECVRSRVADRARGHPTPVWIRYGWEEPLIVGAGGDARSSYANPSDRVLLGHAQAAGTHGTSRPARIVRLARRGAGDGGTVESRRHHDIRCRDRYQSGLDLRWRQAMAARPLRRLNRTAKPDAQGPGPADGVGA